jgi:hypothetical protein
MKQATESAGIHGQVIWDGKDMAVVQMLVCDLRSAGVPACRWKLTDHGVQLYLRRQLGRQDFWHVAVGDIIDRNGLSLSVPGPG